MLTNYSCDANVPVGVGWGRGGLEVEKEITSLGEGAVSVVHVVITDCCVAS